MIVLDIPIIDEDTGYDRFYDTMKHHAMINSSWAAGKAAPE